MPSSYQKPYQTIERTNPCTVAVSSTRLNPMAYRRIGLRIAADCLLEVGVGRRHTLARGTLPQPPNMDLVSDDEVVSLAATALASMMGTPAPANRSPHTATSPKAQRRQVLGCLDLFADGSPIRCCSCLQPKSRPDPAIPGQKVWWKLHGRPEDLGSHSDLDAYCEMVWRKQNMQV